MIVGTTIGDGYTCAFTAVSGSCDADDEEDCRAGTDSTSCGKISGCTWTPTSASCTGGEKCLAVSIPTQNTCEAAGTLKKCTFTAAGCLIHQMMKMHHLI